MSWENESYRHSMARRGVKTSGGYDSPMNQSFVAGIGNLYSDEILFRTKLHPKSKLNQLDNEKVKELFTNIKDIIQFGIDKEGNLSVYPNNFIIKDLGLSNDLF